WHYRQTEFGERDQYSDLDIAVHEQDIDWRRVWQLYSVQVQRRVLEHGADGALLEHGGHRHPPAGKYLHKERPEEERRDSGQKLYFNCRFCGNGKRSTQRVHKREAEGADRGKVPPCEGSLHKLLLQGGRLQEDHGRADWTLQAESAVQGEERQVAE